MLEYFCIRTCIYVKTCTCGFHVVLCGHQHVTTNERVWGKFLSMSNSSSHSQESVNSIIQTGSVKHESKGPIRPTGWLCKVWRTFFFFFFCLQTSPAQGPPSTYPFVFLQFTGITAPKCWSDFSETWARHHLIGLFPKFAQWHSHIDRVAGTFQFSKEALLLLVLLNLSMDFNGSHYFVQYNQPKLITLFLYFTCYNNMWIVIDHEADDLKRDCQCDWAFYFTALCTRKNCITGCTLFCSIISFGGGGILIFLNLF